MISEVLDVCYLEWLDIKASEGPVQSLLIDHYAKFVYDDFEAELKNWWSVKKYLGETIRKRREQSVTYRYPAIILVYFCVSNFPARSKQDAPLPDMFVLRDIFLEGIH
ncbi:hypothetical protein [Bradyrhizobium sp. CCBAU 53380]|uniref:hypothetical protein n=1 Tax=Bradyrhizobium sp. CCBAU 53380 TaxID=1325117 RepID=UPI0023037E91|nr:hypothetical protein [Bradyrhizobium sp. CCBAU 53380]MDA9420789.1 hypothetical protein [Bradyrhizobium sp. CCBAU 53380]